MTQIHETAVSKGWEKDFQKSKWLVFTSGAGVRALLHAVRDIRRLGDKKIAVVGAATAAICHQHGLGVDFVGPGPGATALAEHWPGTFNDEVLHCTGSAEAGGFRSVMQKRGYLVRRSVLYRNMAPSRPPKVVLERLHQEGANWVVFASGTAAERLQGWMGRAWAAATPTAVIGDTTAKTARKAGWKVSALAKDVSAGAVLSAMLKSE